MKHESNENVNHLTPCSNCPWRRDSPRKYWHRDHFLDIYRHCQNDGIHTMLCHKSSSLPSPRLCHGWIAVQGFDSIGVRLACMRGEVTADLVRSGVDPSIPMFDNFDSMMRANGIEPTTLDD